MGFGFSSMPSAQQRAQASLHLPDAEALARAAQQAAMGGGAAPQPQSAPGGPDLSQMNLPMPKQMPTPGAYNPDAINMPAAGGIPTATPWSPGGVNLPAQYSNALAGAGQAAGAGGAAATGASYLSDLAMLFGG